MNPTPPTLRIGPGIECTGDGSRLSWRMDAGPIASLHVERDDSGWVDALSTPFLAEAVGMGGPSGATAEARLIQHLRIGRLRFEETIGRASGRAAIVVPARYTATQRAGMRRVALTAGYPDVEIVNQTVAAVIAHTADRREPSSLLVVVLDRAGFELALVRVARGDHRVLAYDGGNALSVAAIERTIVRRLLKLVQWGGDEGALTGALLHAVLGEAKRVLAVLRGSDRVETRLPVLKDGVGSATAEVSGREVAAELGTAVADLAARARALLDGCGLLATDIDEVLLAGEGVDHLSWLRVTNDVVSRSPVAGRDLLASGAALLARQLAAKPLPEPTVRAEMTPDQAIGTARERLALGDALGARRYLEGVIAEASALLARIPVPASIVGEAPKPAATPAATVTSPRPAKLHLERGERLLAAGDMRAAVDEGHSAWRADQDDVEAFLWMIEAHCRAAERPGVGYEEALRWLECALSHDQANQRVRGLLAECHYREAMARWAAGANAEAASLVERALAFVPDHPGATALHREVRRR